MILIFIHELIFFQTNSPHSLGDFSCIFLCYCFVYTYDEVMNTFLIILVVAIIIWIVGTLIVVRGIEEPAYVLVEKRDGYEIRDYSGYIIAEVEVDGDMRTALNN